VTAPSLTEPQGSGIEAMDATSSIDPGSLPGYSVFGIDPGETTGWCWLLVGKAEIKAHGLSEALRRVKASSGQGVPGQFDRRLMHGEIALNYVPFHGMVDAYPRAEASAVQELVKTMLVMQGMGYRMSKGRIPILTHVVVESFSLRGDRNERSRSLLAPVRMIARLDQELHHQFSIELERVEYQDPSEKGVMTDERLKDLGLYWPGQGHATDATRHAVLKLRKLLNA
jgi:hypothetical protein